MDVRLAKMFRILENVAKILNLSTQSVNLDVSVDIGPQTNHSFIKEALVTAQSEEKMAQVEFLSLQLKYGSVKSNLQKGLNAHTKNWCTN